MGLVGKTTIGPPKELNRRRIGPATTRQPTRDPIVEPRPDNFLSWWAYGVSQAEAARPSTMRLHDEDRPTAHDKNQPIIMGWPFSVGFERYLDADWGKSPFRSAMASFYKPFDRGRVPQRDEYKILFALLGGHTDAETVRALLGNPHIAYFEERAVCALAEVWGRGALMVALAIETDGLPLELLEPPAKKKFSLLCRGDCGRADCQAKNQEGS